MGAGEANEELSNGFHISLKRSDFWLLHDAEWLNDKVRVMLFHGILLLYVYVLQIMNFYMNLITERNKKVFAFSTFFYPKLVAGGYNGVSEWIKAVDIFSMELLLIPTNTLVLSYYRLHLTKILLL